MNRIEEHDLIKQVCAAEFGVTVADLASESRLQELVDARFACVYVLRRHGYTLAHIGVLLNRDHSTIMHAERVMRQRMQVYPSLRVRIEWINREIRNQMYKQPACVSCRYTGPKALRR